MKARIPQTSVATSSRKGWGLTEDRVQEAPPVSPSRPAPGVDPEHSAFPSASQRGGAICPVPNGAEAAEAWVAHVQL